MSTKLNAEELAAQYIPDWSENDFTTKRRGFAMCVEKLAQPIADERDELREALKKCLDFIETDGWSAKWIKEYRSILAKYHKP